MKRAFDLLLTLATAVLWLPTLIVLAVLVRLNLGSPIFFRQERPGLRGRPFTILKLRSMVELRDSSGQLLPDEDRLTSFGRWLRRSSLDELPELLNVIRGDMSLVGPRPLLMQYLDRYTPRQARRHEVRPGLTGWAQVNGRNAISWEEKFELDLWYIEHQSLWLDVKILCRTFHAVIAKRGVTAECSETPPEFAQPQAVSKKVNLS